MRKWGSFDVFCASGGHRSLSTQAGDDAYYAAADDAGDDAYYYAAAGDDVRGPCGEIDFSSRHRLGLRAQAPAYYYYTAADDSTYGYDDSAYAYGYDDAYGHAQCTKSNIVAVRPRHC